MPLQPLIALPLRPNGPPSGYKWEDRSMSTISSPTAFETGLEARDIFLGELRCVVCGETMVHHCHVINSSEVDVWKDLKRRRWIPAKSKAKPEHDPRNGLILCPTHHAGFDKYIYYIRYNHKMIGMPHFPPSSLSTRCGFVATTHSNPFNRHYLPTLAMQDWLISDDLLRKLPNPTNELFKRNPPSGDDDEGGGDDEGDGGDPRKTGQQDMIAATFSGTRESELNETVIAEILAATRAMPSWKACEMENTSWSGTTDENIRKYISSIGVEPP